MNHPEVFNPAALAQFQTAKMGKVTLFQSDRVLIGLNCFEPGQEHRLHTHEDMDKVYHVLEGTGQLLLSDRATPMQAGEMVVTPAGVAHGIRNTSTSRLVVLAVLAPSPQ